jgi:hypothetical protein
MKKRITFQWLRTDGAIVTVDEVVDYFVQDGRILTLVDVMAGGTVRSRFYRGVRKLMVEITQEAAKPLTERALAAHLGGAEAA